MKQRTVALTELEVPEIPADELQIKTTHFLGEGSFGKCALALYKQCYSVCVKSMISDLVDEARLLQEARILTKLSGHRHIPHCFGICRSEMLLVMSLHTVDNKPLSLVEALWSNSKEVGKNKAIKYLSQVATALSYIHRLGYLHNDIKGNNVILGKTQSGEVEAHLIDYGKACHQTKGKVYQLTAEECKEYETKHPHIAPDLRDGLTAQNVQTDVYSLGRLLVKVCTKYAILGEMRKIGRRCLADMSMDRPELSTVLRAIQ